MSQKEMDEIQRLCSPNSLLVITPKGLLYRLYCPFQVMVIRPIDHLKYGSIKVVTKVETSRNIPLIYIVDWKPYAYHHFVLMFR